MKTKMHLISILMTALALASCGGNGPATPEYPEPQILSFNVVSSGKTIAGIINQTSGAISVPGVEYGTSVTNVSYRLSEGARISPYPEIYVGKWPENQSFRVYTDQKSRNYTVNLPDYKSGGDTTAKYMIVGYLPTSRTGVISRDDWKQCTHINLSFANVNSDGTLNYTSVKTAYSGFVKTAHDAGLKVLVSLGGSASGELGKNFAKALFNTDNRTNLYNDILSMIDDMGVDGVDIDFESWSESSVATKDQLSAGLEDLVVRLRKGLSEDKLITTAASKSAKYSAKTIETFDFVNVMAYDQYGPWSSEPGPHSTYDYLVECIRFWQDKGVPDAKIVGGVPFYGWSFPYGSVANAKSYTYAEIVAKYPGAEKSDCVDTYCWYNGLETIQRKTQYVMDKKLAGVMIWEIGQDSTDSTKSLLKRIYDTIHAKK